MQQLDLFDPPKQRFQVGHITARDYQQAGMDQCIALWAAGERGCLFRSPTGSGKTITGALLAQWWLDQGERRRVMVLTHERQLCWQFAQEISDVLGVQPGIEMAERRVATYSLPGVTVASRASLGENGGRLQKFSPSYEWLLILDEAHRYLWGLKSCTHIFEHFEQNTVHRRLGLTATPMRGDGKTLNRILPAVASDYKLWDVDGGPCAVRDGWAVRYDQRFIQVEGVDFKGLREVRDDFDETELAQILGQQETLAKLVEPMLEIVGQKSTLIFSPSVKMARDVAAYIDGVRHERNLDIGEAVPLSGKTPDNERQAVYKRFATNQFQFLSVCGLCKEGYNNPNIQAVAIFRPTKSVTLAEQMKGRGCRPLRGLVDGLATAEERRAAIAASEKSTCQIIDLVGVTGLADCATTAHILGQGKPDEVIDRANQNALDREGPVDMAQEIKLAEQQLTWEAEQVRQREYAKLKPAVDWQDYSVLQGSGGRICKPKKERGARMPFGRHKGALIRELGTVYLNGISKHLKPGWIQQAVQREIAGRYGQRQAVDVNRMLQEAWE